MIKRNMYILSILIILGNILIGCSNPKTIKIGLMGNFTGRASDLSVSARNAIELAIDEYNKAQDKNHIKLIIKDDKGISENAIKVVEEFIKEDVEVIIGPFTSNIAISLKEYLKMDKLLFLSPTVSTSKLSNKDDSFIRIVGTNVVQGKEIAKHFLSEKKDIKKIALVYEYNNRIYSEDVANSFKLEFIANGGDIVYNNYFVSSNEAPLSQIAKEVIESQAEAVLIIAGGIDASQLCQHINKLKSDMVIISGLWAKTEDFITNGGKSVEGAYLVGINEMKTKEYIEFRSKYFDIYKEVPAFSAAYGYDMIQVLIKAVEKADSINSVDIKRAIIDNKGFKGLHDNFIIDKYGDTNRGYSFFKVKNGKYVRIH